MSHGAFMRRRYESRVNAADAARLLGLHRATLARWIKRGYLPAVRCGDKGSQWRIKWSDFKRFVANPPRVRGVRRIVLRAWFNGGEKQEGGAWRRQDGDVPIPKRPKQHRKRG
jgi:excisionase family DNA binding protein